jgi:polyferredoxin
LAAKSTEKRGWNSESWLNLRKSVQVVAFAGFIILFLLSIPLLMRLDPLVMLANLISSRAFELYLVIAVVMIAVSLVFGRAWCGWLCPMGTLLDWFSFKRWRSQRIHIPQGIRSVKYVVLIAIVGAAVFSNLTLLVLDPLTIMVRTFATAVWPGLDALVSWAEGALSNIGPLQDSIGRLDNAIRPLVLPTDAHVYGGGLMFGLALLAIVGLNFVSERFWCRYICPLGAFYGLAGKVSLVRRRVNTNCINCKLCENACPTGTIDRQKGAASDPGECIMCLNCMEACPKSTSDFGLETAPEKFNSYDPGRRQFFIGIGAAALLALLFRVSPLSRKENLHLIRPPGAIEKDMTSKCIRCGECIKACPTAAIQPAGLTETGGEAFWTPVIVPRTGFCQYSCNSCGQVCPVQAIPPLPLEEKRQTPLGWASIDQGRCLPWSQNTPCVVCEEMCPVPHKAIVLSKVTVTGADGSKIELQQPTVIRNRCIGCGLCEFRCPVSGEAAIRVEA